MIGLNSNEKNVCDYYKLFIFQKKLVVLFQTERLRKDKAFCPVFVFHIRTPKFQIALLCIIISLMRWLKNLNQVRE